MIILQIIQRKTPSKHYYIYYDKNNDPITNKKEIKKYVQTFTYRQHTIM